MTDQPAASVIILGYNGRRYVDSCLASIFDQDFGRPYEVLFIDNGSADGTADLAEKHANVRVWRLGENHGYCRGNNMAVALTTGPLLIFLNQDVVVHRAWLRELVAAVESDPAIKVGHANVIHPWNREYAQKERRAVVPAAYAGELSPLGFVEYRTLSADKQAVDTLFLSGVSIILKREVLPDIGGYVFDPDMFSHGEDMDLGLRIRTAGYRVVAAPRAVVYHAHVLEDEVSLKAFTKTVRMIRNRLLSLWKCTGWLEFLPLAAITLIGAPFNARQFGSSRFGKIVYGLLLVPPTLVAAFAALALMPRLAERRRETLSKRRVGRGWLLRTLLFDRASLERTSPLTADERC